MRVERLRGRAGQEQRARILRRDCGLCQACKRKGLVTPASEVDHIASLGRHGTNDDSNLESLCVPCHKIKTAQDKGNIVRGGCDPSGNPIGPSHWNTPQTDEERAAHARAAGWG